MNVRRILRVVWITIVVWTICHALSELNNAVQGTGAARNAKIEEVAQ